MPVGNPITDLSGPGNYVPVTRTLTINGVTYDLSANRTWTVGVGSVSSVGLVMPTGFSVSNSPITTSGDLTVAFASGYSLPTTISQGNWNDAYNFVAAFPTGSLGDLIRFDAFGALESFTPDYMPNPFSVFGEMIYSNGAGAPLIVSPNITTTKKFLSMTGTGLDGGTPTWSTITTTDIGAVPTSRTLTINGTAYDLTADRSWSVGTVTSIGLSSTTSGITIGSTPVTSSGTITIDIASASASSNGLLTSTDWSYFDGKMGNPFSQLGDLVYSNAIGIPLRRSPNVTTTKMFLSQTGDGTTSSAPVWEAITTTTIGAVPTSRTLTINGTAYDLSADRSWSVGTVTSIGISTTTTGVTIGSTPVTSSGTITIDIATASGSSNGLLSSTDWSYFDAKLGNPFSALGQMIYSNAIGIPLAVAPNTTTTRKFLSMTGDGTNGAAPAWNTISVSDVTGAIQLTSLSATSPLLYNNSTGVFSIQVATSTQNGYLAFADWVSFNSKQDAITLTTTGNSGAASLVGTTLNVPEYTLDGLGGMTNPFVAIGDIVYSNAIGVPTRRAGNITTTKMFLSSTGTGTSATAPIWEAITASTVGAVPTTRTLTINDVPFDLSADRSWSVGDYGTW
jgi:predicted heme/steroid binding protein